MQTVLCVKLSSYTNFALLALYIVKVALDGDWYTTVEYNGLLFIIVLTLVFPFFAFLLYQEV